MTSPRPARPAKVSGLAPAAMPRRVISARPRVMMAALPLSPKPELLGGAGGDGDDVLERAAQLDARPRRGCGRAGTSACRACRWRARLTSSSSAAMTELAGRPCAISSARLGPDMARDADPARRAAPRPAPAVMRSSESCSMPLATDSSTASRCRTAARRARRSTRMAADGHGEDRPARRPGAAMRVSADLDLDRHRHVRQVALVAPLRRQLPRLLLVAREQHRPGPCLARCSARVVPHAPAPTTARVGVIVPSATLAPCEPACRWAPAACRARCAATRGRSRSSRARSRITRRSGVPAKPNASRSRFSR